MYVGIEFFIGILLGFWLYKRYFDNVISKKVHDMRIDHERDEAMERLVAIDEYRKTINKNGYSNNGWSCGIKTIDWSEEDRWAQEKERLTRTDRS